MSRAPRSIPELWRRRVNATPFGCAWRVQGEDNQLRSVTWAAAWNQVELLAAAMRQHGLVRGDRVAIIAAPSHEWELAHQATLLAGGITTGICPCWTPADIAYALADSAPALIFSDRAEVLDTFPKTSGRPLPPSFLIGRQSRQAPDSGPPCVADLLRGVSFVGGPLTDRSPPETSDVATILYTSGTTGSPKAIEYTHRQLLVAVEAIADAFPGVGPGDVSLCWLPLEHLFQRMVNLVAVAEGMTTQFVGEPRNILDAIAATKPAFLIGVPRLFEKLLDACRVEGDKFREWSPKVLISGSAPLARRVLDGLAQHGLVVLEAYGISENTIPIAANRPGCFCRGSVGRPFSQNDLRFADTGEILIRGPGLFNGYRGMGQPDDRFTADGFFRTQDYGYLDREGFLHLSGRTSDFIKTSTGRRVSLSRVEAVYSQSPLIDRIVVFGEGRPYLVALIWPVFSTQGDTAAEPSSGAPPTQAADAATVAARLSRDIQRLGESLPPHERIARWACLANAPSVEGGELTQTFKPRRAQIALKYAALLDSLYQRAVASTLQLAPVPDVALPLSVQGAVE
jgi:long-chain acyl-CoA synthetase